MGALLMLLTIVVLVAAGLLLAASLIAKKSWLTKFVLGGVAVWCLLYSVMLIGTSLTSEDSPVALRDTDGKAFCGFYLDCHMHAAVTNVRRARSLGRLKSEGEFHIVTVRVFSNAVRATLGLNAVDVHVVDAQGKTYARHQRAERELGSQADLEMKIAPDESFETTFVFDLPESIDRPKLDIRQGGIESVIEAFLIGDEDSILHGRRYFEMVDTSESTSLR